MTHLNDSEERIADEALAVIDMSSRVLHAPMGSHYQHEKTGQLARAAERFRFKLGGDDGWEQLPDPIDQAKLEAFIAERAQHYALGRALYPGGKPRAAAETAADPFTGPERGFATETVHRARVALACNEAGEAWPAWSGRESAAVAIVLAETARLKAEGLHSLKDAVQYVCDGMLHPPQTLEDAKVFFATIRARVDADVYAKAWGQIGDPQPAG